MELRERFPLMLRRPLLRDVRERGQIDVVIAAEQPEIVFHAAALKHLPMVEANPIEGALTNVVGSRNVAEAARAHGVSLAVSISTDKAVNPTSVMGGPNASPRASARRSISTWRGGTVSPGRPVRASSRFASATSSARPDRWCRCSPASSPPAGR
jgi:O-antigen biosynthesis protein WbqV